VVRNPLVQCSLPPRNSTECTCRAKWNLSGCDCGGVEYEALERDGLILVERIGSLATGVSAISREVARGNLVALRRGAYVRQPTWQTATLRERHVLRVRAAVAAAQRPVLAAGHSAAAVWGMPIAGAWPDDVLLLDEREGGGHIEPGVRRTSIGVRTAVPVEVDGIPVTTLTRTALDIAMRNPFVDAVGSVDWALWRKNPRAVTVADLARELELFANTRGFRRIAQAANFASSLSDSFGESEARAVFHLLGFTAPEQQVEFRDAEGLIETDFYWRGIRTAVEFDGKIKYTRNEFTHGDPGEVAWREKKREDRLRRMNVRVTRILSEHVKRPGRLERILLDAGVPRLHRARGRN
jgi:hypothetical protein